MTGRHNVIDNNSGSPENQIIDNSTNKKVDTLLTNNSNMLPSYDELMTILSSNNGNSLLKKYLTKEVYNEYKDKKTSMGTTLYDVIKSCIAFPTSKVGVYAGDAESYETFKKLFTPIIEEFHKVDANTVYSGKLDQVDIKNKESKLNPESFIDKRMRMGANLDGYRFPSKSTLEERLKIEKEVSECLVNNFGGEYFSVVNTDPKIWDEWQEKGWGFPLEDEYLEAGGIINEAWPRGSGIWMDNPKDPTVIIIINEEDHIRFTGFGREMGEIYNKVTKIYNKLDSDLKFSKHPKYGNLGSCPTNICHMFKTGLRIKLPKLQAQYLEKNNGDLKAAVKELQAIAKEYGCEIRGKGGESSKDFKVMEISNCIRFMNPDEALNKWLDLLTKLTEMENSL